MRNSGFIVSTTLIKLSFNVDGITSHILIIMAVLFGTITLGIYKALSEAKLFNAWTEDINELSFTVPLAYYPYIEHDTVKQRDTVGNLAITLRNSKEWKWQPYYSIKKHSSPELYLPSGGSDIQELKKRVSAFAKSRVNNLEIRDIFKSFMTPEEIRMLAGGSGSANFIITKSGEIISMSAKWMNQGFY